MFFRVLPAIECHGEVDFFGLKFIFHVGQEVANQLALLHKHTPTVEHLRLQIEVTFFGVMPHSCDSSLQLFFSAPLSPSLDPLNLRRCVPLVLQEIFIILNSHLLLKHVFYNWALLIDLFFSMALDSAILPLVEVMPQLSRVPVTETSAKAQVLLFLLTEFTPEVVQIARHSCQVQLVQCLSETIRGILLLAPMSVTLALREATDRVHRVLLHPVVELSCDVGQLN